MFGDDFIYKVLIAAPPILFALTVHEFFHAWTALRYGDSTARDMGRLTLNPLAHLDLFGTIVMFISLASGFFFGWAKPVPVNPYNFRGNPRVADFWISAAGPLSNLALAFLFGMFFRMAIASSLALPEGIYLMLVFAVKINVCLAFFNLIPIFPLDGSHILRNILPESMGPSLNQLERFGPILLLALIFTGGFGYVLGPVVYLFVRLFMGV